MLVAHRVTVKSVSVCADGVVELTLSRPEGYRFAAGQWFRLTLDTAEGPDTRTFSHSSAPVDPDLDMATRLSGSAFKTALSALEPGDVVEIAGPGGRLRLPEGAGRIAVLTGGVGVTPVRSLLRDAIAGGRVFDDAVVLFGNRSAECAPYLDELEAMAAAGVRTVPVFEVAPDGWTGEVGFIDAGVVRRHVDLSDSRAFLVTGPPPMVAAMDGVLDALGVPDGLRTVERFGV